MTGREMVKRAIEFRRPPRLPFWQHQVADAPDDVCDCWEMDRQKAGWFFDQIGEDDWGCGWANAGTKNMGQVEQALRIMENTRTRLETMLQQGEMHGAPEDREGGPPEDSPGGPNEDSPQGMPEGSPGDGSESEGQGGQPEEAGQASEGSSFHEGLEELQFQVEQMMALANQGELTQLAVQATEYGNWVDKLTQLVAEAAVEDPELAEELALLLEDALEGHISGLGSLMSSTSEGARTCLSQAIAYAQNGHDTVAGMFGHGSQEGHQGEGGQHEDPPGGGGK